MTENDDELSIDDKILLTHNALKATLVQEYQTELALMVNNVPEQTIPLTEKLKVLTEGKKVLQNRLKTLREQKNG